jgi:hypothetical protein
MARTASADRSYLGSVKEREHNGKEFPPDCDCPWWWSKGETRDNVPYRHRVPMSVPKAGRRFSYSAEPFRLVFKKNTRDILAIVLDEPVSFETSPLRAPVIEIVNGDWVKAATEFTEMRDIPSEVRELRYRVEHNFQHIEHISAPVGSKFGRLLPPPYVMIDIDLAVYDTGDLAALVEVKGGTRYDDVTFDSTRMTYESAQRLGVRAFGIELHGGMYERMQTDLQYVEDVSSTRWYRSIEDRLTAGE